MDAKRDRPVRANAQERLSETLGSNATSHKMRRHLTERDYETESDSGNDFALANRQNILRWIYQD